LLIRRHEVIKTTQSNKSQIIAILLCRSDQLGLELSSFHLWFAKTTSTQEIRHLPPRHSPLRHLQTSTAGPDSHTLSSTHQPSLG
jgi:hypothetical protein